jgi:hypothetical protein
VCKVGWLALAVSSFVVGVLRIDGIADVITDQNDYRRARFEGALAARIDSLVDPQPRILDEQMSAIANQLLGNRRPESPPAHRLSSSRGHSTSGDAIGGGAHEHSRF